MVSGLSSGLVSGTGPLVVVELSVGAAVGGG